MPDKSTTNRSRRRDLILLGLAVVVAVGLVCGLIMRGADNGDEAASVSASTVAPSAVSPSAVPAPMGPLGDLARRQADDPLAEGSPTAPLTLIEFADLRCPFCAQFSRQTRPVLVDRYVKTGVLRIEWRDMPIFGPQSTAAARAARAAAAQQRFWPFIDAVYGAAPAKGQPDLTTEKLRAFAQEAGVPDIARYDADAVSARFDDAINADLQLAQSLGIPSTPAFSLNGQPVLGAQPTEVFTTMIDKLADGHPATS